MHEYFGKGPSLVKVKKKNNKINIICKDIMTKLEKSLAVNDEGCKYVRTLRKKTFEIYSEEFIHRVELNTNIIIDKLAVKFNVKENNINCLIIIK